MKISLSSLEGTSLSVILPGVPSQLNVGFTFLPALIKILVSYIIHHIKI